MDHDYIKRFDVVERYLRGALVPEEREQFEEHFIDCPECIDCIKTTREIKNGLLLLSFQQASQQKGFDLKKPARSPFRGLFKKTWALAACGLLLAAAVVLVVLANQNHGLRLETDQAKSDSAQWRRRYEEQQQLMSSSEQDRLKTEQDLRGQVRELAAELQEAQKHRGDPAGASQGSTQPGINFPIFVLSPARRGEQKPSDVTQINLTRSQPGFVMSLPLDGEAKYKTYRVTVIANDRRFWGSSGLEPDNDKALTIRFDSNFFPPGDYLLQVAGVPSEGDSGVLGSYYFRINKRP